MVDSRHLQGVVCSILTGQGDPFTRIEPPDYPTFLSRPAAFARHLHGGFMHRWLAAYSRHSYEVKYAIFARGIFQLGTSVQICGDTADGELCAYLSPEDLIITLEDYQFTDDEPRNGCGSIGDSLRAQMRAREAALRPAVSPVEPG